MKVFVFKAEGGDGHYGFVSHNDASLLPRRLGPWNFFKEMELDRKDPPRIGVDSIEIMNHLEVEEFVVTQTKIIVNESIN